MRFIIPVLFLLLPSCTVGAGSCQSPVLDACSQKAKEISSEIDKIAVERNETPQEMTDEFMTACQGQLQSDLDQTLSAIQAIADAGAPASSKGKQP